MNTVNSDFISLIKPLEGIADLNSRKNADHKTEEFFGVFQNAWDQVKETRADYANEQFLLATGQTDDPHKVMIASSKAELSVELLVQLRNKTLEAYDQLIKTGF